MEPIVTAFHTSAPWLATVLIGSVWQGTLLTAGVALALRSLRSVSPAARTAIWMAVLFLVLLLPFLGGAIAHPASAHAEVHVAQDWSVGLLAVWVMFSVLRAARLAVNAVRLTRLARRATPVPASEAVSVLLQGARTAELCVSPEVDRPSVAGFFRPRILLPFGLMAGLSEAELEHVVLHEMEHLRRWDDWFNLLQQVSLVLLPLHPALVWLDRQLCRDRELACDDGVLAATRARKAYAACLVKLAEDSLLRKGVALALSALGTRARESELVGRVRRILSAPERTGTQPMRLTVAALSGAMLVGTGLLAHSPQWLRFDGGRESATVAQAVQPAWQPQAGTLKRMVPVAMQLTQSTARPVLARAIVQGPVSVTKTTRFTTHKGASSKWRTRMMRVTAQLPSKPRWVSVPAVSTAAPAFKVIPASARMPEQPANTAPGGYGARLVVTEVEFSQPVYAAVPTQDGWLIVQL